MGGARRAGVPASARRALAWSQRLSLQAKLSLLLGVVAILPLLLVGPALVSVSRETLRGDALVGAAGSAHLGAGLAERYVADARAVIEELASRPSIVAAVRAGDAATVEAMLSRQLRQFNQFDTFVWRDREGELRARAASSPADRAAAAGQLQREAFAAALRQGTSSLGPARRSAVSGRAIMPIAAPIRDNGEVRGAIVGTVDLTVLGEALGRHRPGPTRSLSVVDLDSGVYLAHPDPARLLQPADDLGAVLPPLRAGQSGALEVADGPGGPSVIGYVILPDVHWGVVASEPREQALGAAIEVQQRGQVLLVLAGLLAMALGWLTGRRLSRPLHELQAATARVAAGELGATVPVRGGDELGQVAASFNQMSAELAEAHAAEGKARRAAEAVAAREALINRINARIRASLDVDAVLRATLEELGTALGAARAFLSLEREGLTLPFAYEWTRPGVEPASSYRPRRLAIAELAVRERRAVAIADLDHDPRLAATGLPPRARTPRHTWAVLVAPLFHGDTLLGVLGIHEVGGPRAWTPDEIALVEAVAGEAAVALANARLYEAAQMRAQRLAAVAQINRAISARLDLSALTAVVADALGQIVPFESLGLIWLDPDGQTYRVLSHTAHVVAPPDSGGRIPVAGSRIAELLQNPVPMVKEDLNAGTRPLTAQEEQLRASGYHSNVLLPICAQPERPGESGRLLGALGLASRERDRYGPAELEVLAPIVEQLAVALRNVELYTEVVASQRRLETIVGGIADGVLVADPSDRITLWNPAAERLLGFHAADVLGRPWPMVIQGRDASGQPLAAAATAWQQAHTVTYADAQFVTHDGAELWVSVSLAPLAVADERHWVMVFRDISAYKQVEQLKSDFVATVSHELRTPLASIKGYAATLLQRRDRLPPQAQDDYLTIINDEANRLNALVTDLLQVARLERGEVRLEAVPTVLLPIVQRVVTRFVHAQGATNGVAPLPAPGSAESPPARPSGLGERSLVPLDAEPGSPQDGESANPSPNSPQDWGAEDAPGNGAAALPRLVVAVPPDLVARAAPDRLEQVIANLIENAIKYSPRGGTVRVTAGPRGADTVSLAVSDEGIGIPEERQGELFRPFARVEHVLTQQTQGAGLGLYICKQLVERMGGTIALASAPGRGTTVTVTLPAV
ncbi:MAG TPA: ATP-binding protein [Chloroflexota bacterium]|nr:ATP-binding protein [Chloroflexota bacterium]